MPAPRLHALALTLLAACTAGERPADTPDEGATMAPELAFTLATTRATWAPGDTVVAALDLVNRGGGEAVLPFSSGQRYDLALTEEAGDTLWRWSNERGFIQALGEERLAAGASLHWEEAVTLPAAPGRYLLSAWVTSPGAPPAEPLLLEVRAP
jgi:hypothetical protein